MVPDYPRLYTLTEADAEKREDPVDFVYPSTSL